MRSLALGLAVPLFCTFAVSLPYQEDVENAIPLRQVGGDDTLLALLNSGDNAIPSQYNGANAVPSYPDDGDITIQALNTALTPVGVPQTSYSFEYLPSIEELAAKPPKPPGNTPQGQTRPGQNRKTQPVSPNPGDILPQPPKAGDSQQLTPGNLQQPTPGNLQQSTPGNLQLLPPGTGDPNALPDNPHPNLPWVQGDSGPLPDDLLVYDKEQQYGFLGDYTCRFNGLYGDVVSPNHQPSPPFSPSCSN